MSNPDRLEIEMSGGCQCGAIRFHATELINNPHICYCRMCQKATGQLMATAVGVRHQHLAWSRGKPAVFKSSEHVERGFCAECGTPLFFRWRGGPHVSIALGAFDLPHRIPVLAQMGTEGKHPSLANLDAIEDRGSTEEMSPEGTAEIRRTNRQHPDHDTAVWPPPEGFPQ